MEQGANHPITLMLREDPEPANQHTAHLSCNNKQTSRIHATPTTAKSREVAPRTSGPLHLPMAPAKQRPRFRGEEGMGREIGCGRGIKHKP